MKSLRLQSGGTALGLIVGLLIGLGVAVAVALYVSKVPVPFIDRLPQRTSDQDAAEAERNRNWNPNAPLSGKGAVGPAASPNPVDAGAAPAGATPPGATTDPRAGVATLPAAPSAGLPSPPSAARPEVTGLFIQAGAYGRMEDAEQQRAKLAMLGFSARISEREQNGKPVYRVRVGPYEAREETQGPMDRLIGSGIEVTLVRVERSPSP